jgi:hypothetical protein
MPDMTVIVQTKKAYGREMLEPKNETARLFCELLQVKNLTLDNLRIIKRLGFQVAATNPLEGLED